MVSLGDKATLINRVLNIIPIYTLSAIVPPKCVITELHKTFAYVIFWNNKQIFIWCLQSNVRKVAVEIQNR